jgi:hypothetical protein
MFFAIINDYDFLSKFFLLLRSFVKLESVTVVGTHSDTTTRHLLLHHFKKNGVLCGARII